MKIGCLVTPLIVFLALISTVVATEGDPRSRGSSLKIDDDQLSELTAADAANDLRTIDYDDRAAEKSGPEATEGATHANLRENNLEFRREIARLERSLSELNERYRRLLRSRRKSDARRMCDISLEGEYAPAMAYVLDSNPKLNLVVLSAGADDGVRPGLVYRVVRERRVVARLRVVILRRRICAARVLEEGREEYPGIGDEAVLGQPEK